MIQNPRTNAMMTPYLIVLWGTVGGWSSLSICASEHLLTTLCSACTYMMGRKVTGHNTWFGKD
jgi:hypothetical protein